MVENTRKLILYHADCLDGFGAAMVARMNLGADHDYVPVQYDEPECTVPVAGRDVFILDFSYPAQEMNRILREADSVVWLDHHETAFKRWCPNHEHDRFTQDEFCYINPVSCHIVLDKNRSGTMLAWNYFYPASFAPIMIELLNDQDLWQFKYAATKPFIAYLASRERTFEAWLRVYVRTTSDHGYDENQELLERCTIGGVLLEERERQIESILKLKQKCFIWDAEKERVAEGLIANCPAFLRSDVGSRLAEMSGTYGATWFVQANGMAKVSLRSRGEFNVEELASQYGGGGHKKASSFYTSVADCAALTTHEEG